MKPRWGLGRAGSYRPQCDSRRSKSRQALFITYQWSRCSCVTNEPEPFSLLTSAGWLRGARHRGWTWPDFLLSGLARLAGSWLVSRGVGPGDWLCSLLLRPPAG